MNATLISETTQKARKPHMCEECHQPIETGTIYQRQFLVDMGDSWTWKSHIDCHKASWEIFEDAGLVWGDEWMGIANSAADCGHEWTTSTARFLRRHPEYADVRKRFLFDAYAVAQISSRLESGTRPQMCRAY